VVFRVFYLKQEKLLMAMMELHSLIKTSTLLWKPSKKLSRRIPYGLMPFNTNLSSIYLSRKFASLMMRYMEALIISHLVKMLTISESFNALGSSGAKLQVSPVENNKKSWNYTRFSKMRDKLRSIAKMMMIWLILIFFFICLVKWSSNMKSLSVARRFWD